MIDIPKTMKVVLIIVSCVLFDLIVEELSGRPLNSSVTHVEQYTERVCSVDEHSAFCAEARRALVAWETDRE